MVESWSSHSRRCRGWVDSLTFRSAEESSRRRRQLAAGECINLNISDDHKALIESVTIRSLWAHAGDVQRVRVCVRRRRHDGPIK